MQKGIERKDNIGVRKENDDRISLPPILENPEKLKVCDNEGVKKITIFGEIEYERFFIREI